MQDTQRDSRGTQVAIESRTTMLREGLWLGLVAYEEEYVRNFLIEEIRRLLKSGHKDIVAYQSKRYIDVDAISVDGKWFPVYLNTDMDDRCVVCPKDRTPAAEQIKLVGHTDVNGRWVTAEER